MRLRFLMSFAVVTTLVGVAALHGGDEKCDASSRECTQQIRHMLSGRRYLGIEVVDLKPGLVIKTVLPDSPAAHTLKAGDRLVGVNGRSLTRASKEQFKQYVAEGQTGKLFLIVQRRGAYRKVEARLEPYPKEYIDKVISAHLSQAHTATAGAQP